MGRRSSLEQLPRELQDTFGRLLREGRTITEITDKLNELDAGVSQSAVGRSVKRAREQMRHYREAQELAGSWVTQLGENPAGDVGALLAEMLKTVAFQAIAGMGASEDGEAKAKAPKAMDIMLLAKSIRDLAAHAKQNMERRAAIERAVIERAAKTAGDVGTRAGLSQATIDEIQKELRLL
jgi:hypothetical protein